MLLERKPRPEIPHQFLFAEILEDPGILRGVVDCQQIAPQHEGRNTRLIPMPFLFREPIVVAGSRIAHPARANIRKPERTHVGEQVIAIALCGHINQAGRRAVLDGRQDMHRDGRDGQHFPRRVRVGMRPRRVDAEAHPQRAGVIGHAKTSA